MWIWVYTGIAFAQDELFVNREVRQAYLSGTRSADGKPGKNYWQNKSDYEIQVQFWPETGIVEGKEEIIYYNNSPDTLKKIVVRLYQDLFKKGTSRILDVNADDLTDGVVIRSVMNNDKVISLDAADRQIHRSGTNMFINLNDALKPASRTKISIVWSFSVPSKTQIRMGQYDSSAFFIGQWYPQIAVYDDIGGWDTHDYNGLSEFYNDFATFDVAITVPGNYVVWATGMLSNPGEVLTESCLAAYQKAMNSSEPLAIAHTGDYLKGNVTTKASWNTWKYKADQVSDFAFALSDHYVWEACSIDAGAGRKKVFIQTAYNAEHTDYKEAMVIAQKTIRFLSEKLPGIPYPFPCMSIFDGSDGMEYPMMTNVGTFIDRGETVYAHSHEITHTYFPFYVGTNETRYGWMDESMAVFLPEQLQKEIEPSKDVAPYTTYVYSLFAGNEFEPAVMTPTNYLTRDIYFILNYGKAEQILRLLRMQLGEEVFLKCLQTFMEDWKYKHPTPWDFFNTFNTVSGQNLSWFWNAWYFKQGSPDLTISSVNCEKGRCSVEIKNSGNLPLPVHLEFITAGGNNIGYDVPANHWKDGKDNIIITRDIPDKVTTVRLGNENIPDINPSDNIYNIK